MSRGPINCDTLKCYWHCAKKNGKRTTPDNNNMAASGMKHNNIIKIIIILRYTIYRDTIPWGIQ